MTTSDFLSLILATPHSETLPLELRRFVKNHYDHITEIRLADGGLIRDVSDLREHYREAMRVLDAVIEKRRAA